MSAFSAIDLSRLPPPDVVETIDYEAILDGLKADMKLALDDPALLPNWDPTQESDTIVKLLETLAYREMLLRQRVNDGARAVLLATAVKADLDNLAAWYGVSRLLVSPANDTAIPPVPAVWESDPRLRTRTQMALEGFTTAGPVGAYIFHALTASALVKDVSIASPEPGDVLVTVLSTEGDGVPAPALLSAVEAALNADDVRPLCDTVIVAAATITPYAVTAHLTLFSGPDPVQVLAAAETAAQAYTDQCHAIGRRVTLSGLYAALQQPGVESVTLAAPLAPVDPGPGGAAWCIGITLTGGVADG